MKLFSKKTLCVTFLLIAIAIIAMNDSYKAKASGIFWGTNPDSGPVLTAIGWNEGDQVLADAAGIKYASFRKVSGTWGN